MTSLFLEQTNGCIKLKREKKPAFFFRSDLSIECYFSYLFFLFTSTYAHQCSSQTPKNYEQIYLCREKLNSTSLRVWLRIRLNQTQRYQLTTFPYYIFTLRVIDLLHEEKIELKDRFEQQVGDYVPIDLHRKEKNTITIHNLFPGRYEVCVNFFPNRSREFYYRSSNSCIHIPWDVPEDEDGSGNSFVHAIFMVVIILLLVSSVFFIYVVHRCFKPSPPARSVSPADDTDEEDATNERAKFLVNKHFVHDKSPLEHLIRNRIHQRYAHRFE